MTASRTIEYSDGLVLPEGWYVVSVLETGDTFTGSTPPKKESRYYGGATPFFKPTDLDAGYFVLRATDSLSESGVEKARIFPENSVLVTCIGATIGKTGLARVAGSTNQQVNVIVPNAEVADPYFLYFYFTSSEMQSQIKSNASSTTLPILNKGRFNRLSVRLPPKNEQTRIVTAIESLQQRSARARTLLSNVRPKLDNLRQSILQAAFSGRLTADWRAKNPDVEPADVLLDRIRTERRQRWEAAELSKYEAKGNKPPKNWQDKYKEPVPVDDSELPELPEGWCWVTMEFATSFSQGVQVPVKKQFESPSENSVRFLRISDFTKNDEPPRFIQHPGNSYVVYEQDISMVRYGASTGFVCTGLQGAIANNLFRIAPSTELLVDDYLYYLLVSSSVQNHIASVIKGNAMPAVSFELLYDIPIPIPSVEEQSRIAKIVKEALEGRKLVEVTLRKTVGKLSRLDQSILSKAFRGELVPQDPNDEPASELLARIRASREAEAAAKKASKKKAGSKKKAKKTSSRVKKP